MKSRTIYFLLLAIGIGVLVWWLSSQFPTSLDSHGERAGLVQSFLILMLIASGIFFSTRINLKGAAKALLIWGAIGLFLVTAYSLRDDFMSIAGKVSGELTPHTPWSNDEGELVLRRDASGHFAIRAEVNGTPVSFLVDTGASVLTLSQRDAERAGIDIASLSFNVPLQTASGSDWGARARLNVLAFGGVEFQGVRAIVGSEGLSTSLLGMNVLNSLSAFSVEGNEMRLRP